MAVARLVVVTELRPGLELVRCARLACTLSAAVCARRAVASWPSGRRKGAPRFTPCGRCLEGAARAARLARAGWVPPPDSQPSEVLEPAQRRARARWLRTFPERAAPSERGSLGPLEEAALGTPDDRGVVVDGGRALATDPESSCARTP